VAELLLDHCFKEDLASFFQYNWSLASVKSKLLPFSD